MAVNQQAWRRRWLGLAVALWPALAAALSVDFDLQPRVLKVGEPAACSFTVRGVESPPHPPMPSIPGLQIMGPSVQQNFSMQSVNGRMQQDVSVTFNYQVVPLQEGTFQVGPFTYEAGGQSTVIPAVELKAAGANTEVTQGGRSSEGGQGLFAKIFSERTSVYNQELFEVYINIYFRGLNLGGNIELLNLPATGLKFQQFQELNPTREIINNEVFDVRRFRSQAQALTAGRFQLQPSLRVPVLVERDRRRRYGFFEDPFFDLFGRGAETQPVVVEAGSLDMEVKPLPAQGQPASFSGAVGEFQFAVQVNPTDLAVGEPITINMLVSGGGNIENVVAPRLDLGDQFKVYEPRLVTSDAQDGTRIIRKEFEQVVIPKAAGISNLPAVAFSFFNPLKEQYETISRGPFPLTLHASSTQTAVLQAPSAAAGAAPAPARILGADILYLQPAPARWLRAGVAPWYRQPWFWLLQLLPAGALLATGFAVRRRDVLQRDVARARRSQAPRSARAGLRKAEQALAAGQRRQFFEGAWEALSSYYGNRLNLAPGEVAGPAVVAALRRGGLEEELCGRLERLFACCDQERYAACSSGVDPADILKTLPALLKASEKVKL